MVPRVLHRVLLPPMRDEGTVADYWRRFADMHPGWELRTWTTADDLTEVVPLLDACKTPAGKADLIRLEVLLRHGGVYVDTDCEPIRPLDPLLDQPCFIGTEDGQTLTNSVIGAESQHPAIRAYLDRIIEGGPKRLSKLPPDYASGPQVATVALNRPDVTILPREAFFPERPNSDPLHLRPTTDDLAREYPGAYVVHRWAHTWAPPPPLWQRMRAAVRHTRWLVRQRLHR